MCEENEETIPVHLQDLPETSTLVDVIRAINAYRGRRRAIYLAPSLRWTDIQGSNIEIVEES